MMFFKRRFNIVESAKFIVIHKPIFLFFRIIKDKIVIVIKATALPRLVIIFRISVKIGFLIFSTTMVYTEVSSASVSYSKTSSSITKNRITHRNRIIHL